MVVEKKLERPMRAVNLGGMTTSQPIPKNLREQLVDSIVAMSEEQLLALHNAILDVEIERLRNELSEQAEQEQAEGKWDNLQGFIQEYRQRKKSERMKS
ncbi:MAG TPA: hypothetical protein DIT13_10165 [Verrucomicrobiales bacterium]|nr:hypothetical protein [Verrucomicrobiales bacterium]